MTKAADTDVTRLAQALLRDAKFRLMEESVPRILRCLEQLGEEEIWWRPNEETVSVGNLIIHLCGNVRQWIISTLGGEPDHRTRQAEFDERGPIPTAAIIDLLTSTLNRAGEVLDSVDPTTLLDERIVQGEVETGVSILVHVVEHFSYHTGQITYAVKSRKNIDLSYYGERDLDVTS